MDTGLGFPQVPMLCCHRNHFSLLSIYVPYISRSMQLIFNKGESPPLRPMKVITLKYSKNVPYQYTPNKECAAPCWKKNNEVMNRKCEEEFCDVALGIL